MAKVVVPVAELAELLGLDPATDEETVLATMNRVVAQHEADVAAAQQLREDERKVAAAISDGRIGAGRRQFWLQALHEDRDGATRVLASIAAVPLIAAQNPTVSSRPATIEELARPTPGAPFDDMVVTSDEALNAAIEADPAMHRASWAISRGAGGLKPPPEQIFIYPDAETPWNPKPRIVMHNDGTGHWESPPPDYGIAPAP